MSQLGAEETLKATFIAKGNDAKCPSSTEKQVRFGFVLEKTQERPFVLHQVARNVPTDKKSWCRFLIEDVLGLEYDAGQKDRLSIWKRRKDGSLVVLYVVREGGKEFEPSDLLTEDPNDEDGLLALSPDEHKNLVEFVLKKPAGWFDWAWGSSSASSPEEQEEEEEKEEKEEEEHQAGPSKWFGWWGGGGGNRSEAAPSEFESEIEKVAGLEFVRKGCPEKAGLLAMFTVFREAMTVRLYRPAQPVHCADLATRFPSDQGYFPVSTWKKDGQELVVALGPFRSYPLAVSGWAILQTYAPLSLPSDTQDTFLEGKAMTSVAFGQQLSRQERCEKAEQIMRAKYAGNKILCPPARQDRDVVFSLLEPATGKLTTFSVASRPNEGSWCRFLVTQLHLPYKAANKERLTVWKTRSGRTRILFVLPPDFSPLFDFETFGRGESVLSLQEKNILVDFTAQVAQEKTTSRITWVKKKFGLQEKTGTVTEMENLVGMEFLTDNCADEVLQGYAKADLALFSVTGDKTFVVSFFPNELRKGSILSQCQVLKERYPSAPITIWSKRGKPVIAIGPQDGLVALPGRSEDVTRHTIEPNTYAFLKVAVSDQTAGNLLALVKRLLDLYQLFK